MKKKWYLSKEIWVAVIALIGSIVQFFTGYIIDGRLQGMILGGIVLILRGFFTDEKIEW